MLLSRGRHRDRAALNPIGMDFLGLIFEAICLICCFVMLLEVKESQNFAISVWGVNRSYTKTLKFWFKEIKYWNLVTAFSQPFAKYWLSINQTYSSVVWAFSVQTIESVGSWPRYPQDRNKPTAPSFYVSLFLWYNFNFGPVVISQKLNCGPAGCNHLITNRYFYPTIL